MAVDEPVAPARPQHVFAYGTLRRGQANDIERLRPAPVWVGRATLLGRMFDFAGRHPGIVLAHEGDAGAKPVRGEVYRIEPDLLPVLDDIELNYPERPGLYRRVQADLDCAGRRIACWVYELTDGGASASGPVAMAGERIIDWVEWDTRRRR